MSSTPFFLYAEDEVYFFFVREGRADMISQWLITTKKYVWKSETRYRFKVVKPGQGIGFTHFISADFFVVGGGWVHCMLCNGI